MKPLVALHHGDALRWLHTLPDEHVDIWITSPPYADCRTYGLPKSEFRRGMAWVDWYVPYCVEMARTGRLVAVNVSGPVRKHRYSPIVEWLIADLTRRHGLEVGPAPYAWTKPGLFGSGQRNYQRRDWEPVYVFGRPGSFPVKWSDNTAFGHPPKYAPGGQASHRMSSGKRVNVWGANNSSGGARHRNGSREERKKLPLLSRGEAGNTYVPPKIANPGNIIRTGNGGNQLGHPLAHESEAPMNLIVAERFVRWFCPVMGLVGDPMMGSGTSGHAALKWNRRFTGCDIREAQVELSRRRLASVELCDEYYSHAKG